jgi:DNA-binding CsgD family transcriptional regulator
MRGTPVVRPEPDPLVDEALDAVIGLRAAGFTVVPHVAAHLARVYRDPHAVREGAALLGAAELRGVSALPDPLPLTPAIADRFGPAVAALGEWERSVLLHLAVLVDDRAEIVLEASGGDIDMLVASPIAGCIVLAGGRIALAHPALRVFVHETAALADRTRVHARLAAVYAGRGEAGRSAWHRALSTLGGDASLVPALRDLAREADAAGDAAWAFAVAREAAAHATGAERAAVAADAGIAALHAGWVDDALRWLAEARGDPAMEERTVAPWVHAVALSTGEVDDVALDEAEARGADTGRAHAVVAMLAAVWGDGARVRAHLPRAQGPGVDDWCAALGYGAPRADAPQAVTLHARVCAASRCGCAQPAASELSPLARAYRNLLSVLALTWDGDLARAGHTCAGALVSTPFVLPVDGLGVALARRLGVITGGALGRGAPALVPSYPPSPRVRWEAIVDARIVAEQAGVAAAEPDEPESPRERAAALAALAAERAPQLRGAPLYLPGSDELMATGRPARIPEDARLSARVRGNLADAESLSALWRIAEMARGIRSPFERARAELELAAGFARIGQRSRADRALLAADHLFAQAGTGEWGAALRELRARIDRADAAPPDDADENAFDACREAWAPLLTDRELEVALLVAEGLSNGEVAQRLFVSPRTVEVHLRKVFAKLAVRSRVELSVAAHRVLRTTPRVSGEPVGMGRRGL